MNKTGIESSPHTSSRGISVRTIVVLIVFLWAAQAIYAINWGLPNFQSCSLDDAVVPYCSTGLEMMRENNCKYPPLQYLFYEVFLPRSVAGEKDDAEYIMNYTKKIFTGRAITAVMVLGTALIIFYLSRIWVPLWAAMIASVLYLTHGMSVYYTFTTNVDQPYVFWWMLSFWGICAYVNGLSGPPGRNKIPRSVRAVMPFLFGVCSFLSIATKDQAYGLYPLFLIPLLYLAGRKKLSLFSGWKEVISRWMIFGLFAGALLYVTIYWMAGGMDTFRFHCNWLFGQGVEQERNAFGPGLWDRLRLTVHSLKVLFNAVNTPLFVLFMIGAFFWIRSARTDDPGMEKATLMLFFLPFLSYVLFFIQATRFCNARYWLPFIPLICIVSAFGIWRLVERTSRKILWGSFCALLVLWNLLGGLEMLYFFQKETRIRARDFMGSFLASPENTGKTTGVLGAEFGFTFNWDSKRSVLVKMEKVRDWTLVHFGFIALGQMHLLNDPFSIQLMEPDVLIGKSLTAKDLGSLRGMGYSPIEEIRMVRPRINIFPGALSCGDIFILLMEKKKKEAVPSSLSLEEQLLLIQFHRKKLLENEALVRKAGEMAREFSVPDISDTMVHDRDILLLCRAYALAGRKDSAVKACDYLCRLWPAEENLREREKLLSVFRGKQ
jgi:hypothetical protein